LFSAKQLNPISTAIKQLHTASNPN